MNSNEQYTLPPDELDISNAEDEILENQSMIALAEKYRIKAADQYDEPKYTLSQNGQGFAPLGNIMALMAEMKHGKTFVNTSFAAALLKGETGFLGLKGLIPDASVLFFDTEQDLSDGQRIQRRVHYACGWDFNIDNDRFRIFHLREIPYDKRREFISWAIRNYKPTMAIVDGVRDLLQDFNSLDESADLIQELMTLSSECQCAIWTVLHVNPNSEKMRGHLGTELGNKVTDVFRVVKDKDKATGNVSFEVDHVAARHRDVDGWVFRIDDDLPYGIPVLLNKSEILAKEDAKEERTNELREIMSKYIHDPAAISKTKLQKLLTNGEHIGGNKAWKMIEESVELNALEYVIGGKLRICKSSEKPKENNLPF